MEDDRVALSPKRQPAEKIVSQPNKSFEDLLEEAVSARKKKKKSGGKKKLKLLKTSSANDEENSADLVSETFKDGVINLGAELEDEGRVPGAPVAMSSGKLRPARNSIVVLAPIKPTRRRATTSSPPPSEPDNNEGSHLNGKSSPWDNEEQGRLDATVLNVVETSAVADSPARSCKSLKSSKEGSAPRSPTKSAHSFGSASVSSSPVSLNSASPTAPQTKRRRRKLTRAHNQLQEMNVPIEMTPLRASSREAGAKSPIEESQNTMLSVRIHLCEIPLATMPAAGIFLRVHVFDTETGSALKTTQDQSVPSASTGLVSKFRGKLALVEQELNFEAPLQLALENDVVLFFELLVPKLNNYSSCYARLDIQERCIGWAFLKLRSSSTGQYNTDAKLRLQIYEATGLPKFSPSQPFKTVHGWWSKGPWKKTRCSVFVTVGGSAAVGNSRRNYNNSSRKSSKTASNCDMAADDGRPSSRDAQGNSRTTLASHSKSFEPILLRKKGHLCKVTDKFSKPLSAPTYNCLSAAFSESGSLLAAAANQNIHIFQAADFGLKCVLQGHEGLIYCVSWLDEKWLVTSSADCLAIVWDTVSETISKMLPHPSFVYCAKFVPGEKNAIITGSKDKTLRVWCAEEDDDEGEYDLWQELDGHQGFVTAMCFDGSAILYSADSEGHILSWAKSTDKSTRQHDWLVQREFLLPDLKGVSISALQVHPSGKRIFISARDSVVRMLDVLTGVVLQNYLGALSHKIQTGLCLSPCGSLLMAGSEDGSVVVWQADTGKVITCLSSPDCPPATALAFHPNVHLLVVGHFGHNPINLWIPSAAELTSLAQGDEADAAGRKLGLPQQTTQLIVDHLRLQDIIARIDRVLLTSTAEEK